MRLDEILEMWTQDSPICETSLAQAALATASLHAKYLRLLVIYKMRRTDLEDTYDVLRRQKFRYFRGELSKDELDELGWPQWQYAKPLKSEMEEHVRGDTELRALTTKIEYVKTTIESIESIMQQLKQRDFGMGNSIKWKIFLAVG